MIRRLSKKWLVFIFALLSLVAWAGYGYVNSEAYLLSKHNAITYKEWSKISAEELADALEKGEFNPDQLILRTVNGELSISPAIVLAVFNNEKEYLRLLLDYGANVNLSGKGQGYKFIALSIAAHKKRTEMMEMLLKAGANPNVRTKKLYNLTALLHLLDVLEEGLNEKERISRDEELKNMIALLVEKGADINAIDEDGNNIIHYLTAQCRGNLIEYAAQMGADVNLGNNTYATPMFWASALFRDSIPALLEAGADPNYGSSKGRLSTPLNSMVVYATNPTIGIQVLLDGGADINQDIGRGTPLKFAKLRANGYVVYYKLYSETHDDFVKKHSSNCPLARADFAQKQSMEEWQRKGQEAVDMLLAHGAKDDANKQPVDEDIVAANLSAIFAGFQSRVRGIDHVR